MMVLCCIILPTRVYTSQRKTDETEIELQDLHNKSVIITLLYDYFPIARTNIVNIYYCSIHTEILFSNVLIKSPRSLNTGSLTFKLKSSALYLVNVSLSVST